MEYKVYKEDKYTIHTIKTDRFKNCTLEILFKQNMTRENVTSITLLSDLLSYSSKKYKTKRDLSIELENLYNAYSRFFFSRIGKSCHLALSTSFLDPKYCDEGYLEDVIQLPFELLLNPNVEDGKFDKKSFNICKDRLKADLESIKDIAVRYALIQSLKAMDEDSISSINMSGSLEELAKIDEESLVKFYKDFLKNTEIEIYVVGNLDMDKVVSLINKYFKVERVIETDKDLFVVNKVKDEVTDVVESGRYEQSTLVVIYNLIDFTKRERDIVFNVFNYIFGSGSLTSKLYKYVREENSLCYSIGCSYDKYDSLCTVVAGIDSNNKDKCIELINKSLQEMIDGKFSDEELLDSINSAVMMVKSTEDTPTGIIGTYFYHINDGTELVPEKIKLYESVTKEEVMEVAKKIRMNTVYLLKGEDEK